MKHLKRYLVLGALLGAGVIAAQDQVAEAKKAPPVPAWFSEYYGEDTVALFPRAFYDINVKTPETMRDFLWVIDSTYDLMISKGAPPQAIKFIISLRGLSVLYASEGFGDPETDPDNAAIAEEIQGYLSSLSSKGARIEACIISCNWVGVDPDTLLEDVVVIDNAFASSVFYQTKGYALVPITELP